MHTCKRGPRTRGGSVFLSQGMLWKGIRHSTFSVRKEGEKLGRGLPTQRGGGLFHAVWSEQKQYQSSNLTSPPHPTAPTVLFAPPPHLIWAGRPREPVGRCGARLHKILKKSALKILIGYFCVLRLTRTPWHISHKLTGVLVGLRNPLPCVRRMGKPTGDFFEGILLGNRLYLESITKQSLFLFIT